MTFERSPQHSRPDVPENFDIDTSNLMPGQYSLVVEVRDKHSGRSRRR